MTNYISEANPLVNSQLKLPEYFHERIQNYVTLQTGGGPTDERRPFGRVVDFWFLAVCIGAHFNERKTLSGKDWDFNTGVVLSQHPDKIQLLELLAIADNDDTPQDSIKTAGKVAEIANMYAAGGTELLIQWLDAKGGASVGDLIGDKIHDIIDNPQ